MLAGETIYGVLKSNMQKRLGEIPDAIAKAKSDCTKAVKSARAKRDEAVAALVKEAKDLESVLGTGRVDSEPAAPAAAGAGEEGGGDE